MLIIIIDFLISDVMPCVVCDVIDFGPHSSHFLSIIYLFRKGWCLIIRKETCSAVSICAVFSLSLLFVVSVRCSVERTFIIIIFRWQLLPHWPPSGGPFGSASRPWSHYWAHFCWGSGWRLREGSRTQPICPVCYRLLIKRTNRDSVKCVMSHLVS